VAPKALFARAMLAVATVVVLFIAFSIAGNKTIHQQAVQIPANAVAGSPESAIFAGPMFVSESSNLQVKVESPVSNTWLYLEGALINDETGEVNEFDTEVSYYSGYDSDGSWSEGSTTEYRHIPSVPPGRYTLRLEPQWETGHPPPSYALTVKSRVPRFYHMFLVVLALVAWPALQLWRWFRFETERWSESDHPWIESSSGGDDDDDSSGDD
jgi:hypothetical protein